MVLLLDYIVTSAYCQGKHLINIVDTFNIYIFFCG